VVRREGDAKLGRYDVIVAGAGLAGISAALFLARAGVAVAVFDDAGSSLRRVSKVNNYLGFPDGIGGEELLRLGSAHAQKFGASVISERIDSVARDADGFSVVAPGGAHHCTYFVLASNKRTDLATGLGLALGGFGGRFVDVADDGATALDGCYAAGRITGLPSQAIVSAGDGAKVAIAIVQRMRGGYYVDHDV
jgi:thioredoxin reductase (NADPH)